ncbi:MAG: glycine C-acetyltransferase [Victivallales bacterium]|nr:glycine C-acetyltransferase [Victivallales bacterium]
MQAFDIINRTLNDIKNSGLYKNEREIGSSQQPEITLGDGREVLNMCANNYLGLANHPEIIAAAEDGLKKWGFGLASVRFICGTQSIHKKLESELSNFLGTEDTILYSSCFDANGGLFETLLGEEDAIISDELNHASIIDGIRLCKARRLRYKNRCVSALEEQLKEAAGARIRLIATDGVFSMDGSYAPLDDICALAQKYDALVMVDDSHACGFTGSDGSGTPAMFGVKDQVHIVTGTLGKALGGAGGGFTSGRQEIIDLLRQRSRPYLFSNTLSPAIVCASLKALELARNPELREKLKRNTVYFRNGMAQAGFDVPPGDHPIVPIMLGDAVRAANMAEQLMQKNIYAVGFFYPVVPMGKARIRVQISAAHTTEELDRAIAAFAALK